MKHRPASGKKTYVMIGLLAILFISMGYLSMQRREGMTGKGKKEEEEMEGMKVKKNEEDEE